jgi:hypothetical protein
MKKIAHLTYHVESAKFQSLKKHIDGLAFWNEEDGIVTVKFGSRKLEKYIIK